MRTQPHHIRMKPYNRPQLAQQHRIAVEDDLSPLEQGLLMYAGMTQPNYRRYPQGYYSYETQH